MKSTKYIIYKVFNKSLKMKLEILLVFVLLHNYLADSSPEDISGFDEGSGLGDEFNTKSVEERSFI